MENAAGERLGHEALAKMLEPVGADAHHWIEGIVHKVKAYAGETPFPDDIAAFAAVYEG
jgi:serine phosphatase RsbU (regulator of sigma subunit)